MSAAWDRVAVDFAGQLTWPRHDFHRGSSSRSPFMLGSIAEPCRCRPDALTMVLGGPAYKFQRGLHRGNKKRLAEAVGVSDWWRRADEQDEAVSKALLGNAP